MSTHYAYQIAYRIKKASKINGFGVSSMGSTPIIRSIELGSRSYDSRPFLCFYDSFWLKK